MKKQGFVLSLLAVLFLSAILLFAGCSQGEEGVGDLGSVAGIVSDSSTGDPIEGVAVTVGDKSTNTDAQGRYLILSVKQGNYTLTATKEGYNNYSEDITVQGEQTTVVLIGLTPSPIDPDNGTVTGIVTVAESNVAVGTRTPQPIEGVEVTIGELTATTDEQGVYTINNVPPGTGLAITASKEGYEDYEGTVDVVAGETTQHNFSMKSLFIQVSSGQYHTVAMKSDGTVWTWGRNEYGLLGIGDDTVISVNTPVQVVAPVNEDVVGQVNGEEAEYLTDIIAIDAGQYHTVALKSDGTVWTWGRNEYGQLGNGGNNEGNIRLVNGILYYSNRPVQVLAPVVVVPAEVNGEEPQYLEGITAVAAGEYHTMALMEDGTVWTWGRNNWGQLGNWDCGDESIPVQVVAPTNMELAIEPDGYLEGITAIDAGSSHCMALMEDGTVWTWGRGSDGQLGNNSTGSWSKPVQVWGQGNIVREPNRGEPVYLENITAIAAGYWHSVALMDDGTVWTWGNGYYGQMGDGSDSGIREIPVQVWAPGSATDEQSRPVINYLTGITAITAGDLHTMALNEDSNVFTWGYNDRGQLGIGEAPDQSIPVQVWGGDTGDAFLGGVTVITAGFEYTAAIKADGSVWAWGRNDYGQLGDGTEDDKDTPVQVVGTP